MYLYHLKVVPANPHASIDFGSDQVRTLLERYIDNFNQASDRMSNPKHIQLTGAGQDYFLITLSSSVPLTSPGRAIRTLSRLAVEDPADDTFQQLVTAGGQLFRSLPAEERQATAAPTEGMDDLEFLKRLMDYVYGRRDSGGTYLRKRRTMEKLKAIALSERLFD